MNDFSEYIPNNEQGMHCLQGLYFNNPSNKAKQLYFYPLWAGEYLVNYPYLIDRQYMNSFIIFLIKRGKLSFTFDNRHDFIASENSVVIMDCKHRNHYFANTSCQFIFFHFNAIDAQMLYDFITKKGINCFNATDTIQHLINQIFNLLKTQSFSERETTFSELIYKLLISLTTISDTIPMDHSGLKTTPPLITQALEYLEKHYKEKVTISTLCQQLSVSPTLLSKQFHTYTDSTVHSYLTSVRILHAKKMLTTNPGLSISVVAEKCGFHDTSHLNKVFKKETGMTPSKFKQICF
ncbi:AraC family transcriptional regulator [Lactiplantibacillus modestisalitolerans]|uniref:Helix-turn-helix domain-containing protein n=1 Tax=Lactiplantibacillus modestisalitolerans TaxID=1457219 RepID=A0ABV5WV77_9LACO|nr:AraC family transcriptional regulator [Lactiplantibacillus modestisalitolerans]